MLATTFCMFSFVVIWKKSQFSKQGPMPNLIFFFFFFSLGRKKNGKNHIDKLLWQFGKVEAIYPLGDTVYLQILLILCETPQVFQK